MTTLRRRTQRRQKKIALREMKEHSENIKLVFGTLALLFAMAMNNEQTIDDKYRQTVGTYNEHLIKQRINNVLRRLQWERTLPTFWCPRTQQIMRIEAPELPGQLRKLTKELQGAQKQRETLETSDPWRRRLRISIEYIFCRGAEGCTPGNTCAFLLFVCAAFCMAFFVSFSMCTEFRDELSACLGGSSHGEY